MSKGAETRSTILEDALSQASVQGFEGLTLGALAKSTGLSKSGLYAHFGSKEQLQLQVLEEARRRFVDRVVAPALREPRGEPRVRALLLNWAAWTRSIPGGCPFVSAAVEYDDRPGNLRKHLVAGQSEWNETLHTAARIAVEEGHFRPDLDLEVWTFEIWGLALAYNYYARLLRHEHAEETMRRSLDALIEGARVPR